jgi:hypothetical protein
MTKLIVASSSFAKAPTKKTPDLIAIFCMMVLGKV